MPICPNCGVELAEGSKHCPLCHTAIEPSAERPAAGAGPYPEKALDPEQFERLSDADKRKVFLEVMAVCSMIAGATVLAIELLVDRRVSWSLYPIVSVAYLYVLVSVPLAMAERRWKAACVLAVATPLFVLSLDLIDPTKAWFLTKGAPIVFIVEASALVSAAFIARLKRKGVNALAIALLGAASACAGIETVTDLASGAAVKLQWSAVVAVTCLPIAGLLFYLHYRIARRASLKRLFHL